MLRPAPAELLEGVADALHETVLGTMPRGPARNQVQAAIGIVRRCAAALAVHGPLLHAECTDLTDSLRLIAGADADLVADRATFDEALGAAEAVLAGVYPSVPELTELALSLQGQLAQLAMRAERGESAELPAIRELFGRMLAREQELGLSPW